MPLDPGTTLGPYTITDPLGAGGMGEVYRARDTRLDRDVAIKVLPAHLSASPEARQRFEREARSASREVSMTVSVRGRRGSGSTGRPFRRTSK